MRCQVKSYNERNPYELLPASNVGDSVQTAQINWEEGGDDVKSVWPLRPGLHTCYNVQYSRNRDREVEEISKTGLSSDCRLQLAYMKLESLVMVHSYGTVNTFPGLVHTARHIMEAARTRSIFNKRVLRCRW